MPDVTYGFNGNPDSIVTGSALYTVPAGKYAYITAVSGANEFEVDAHVVFPSGSGGVTASVTASSATIFTNGFSTLAQKVIVSSNTGATGGGVSLNNGSGSTFLIDNTYPQPVEVSVPAGWWIAHSCTAGTRTTMVTFIDSSEVEFWAPEGTTVEGGEYIVQLF